MNVLCFLARLLLCKSLYSCTNRTLTNRPKRQFARGFGGCEVTVQDNTSRASCVLTLMAAGGQAAATKHPAATINMFPYERPSNEQSTIKLIFILCSALFSCKSSLNKSCLLEVSGVLRAVLARRCTEHEHPRANRGAQRLMRMNSVLS